MRVTLRQICFFLLLVHVFSMPWQEASSALGSRAASAVLVGLLILLTLVVVVSEGSAKRPPLFVGAMFLFAVWQLVTVLWSIDTEVTLRRAITLAGIVAMVWIVTEMAPTEQMRFGLMQSYVLGCVPLGGAILLSYITGSPLASTRYAPEGFSLNVSADLLAVGIVLALILLAPARNRWWLWFNVGFVSFAVFAVILTGSRSGFAATCLALLGLLFVIKRAKPIHRLGWVLFILTVFTSAFFALSGSTGLRQNLERITLSTDTESASTLGRRTEIWSAGLTLVRENPLGGIGAGNFSEGVRSLMDRARAPHNLFVAVTVESGIIGLVLLISIVFSSLLPTVLARAPRRALYLILFGVLMLFASLANVDTNQAVWLGMAMLSLARAGEEFEPGRASEGPRATGAPYPYATRYRLVERR